MLIQEDESPATEPTSSSSNCLQNEQVIHNILSFLDTKSLSIASAVCKQWHHLASDSLKFWKPAFMRDFKTEFDKMEQKDDMSKLTLFID
jgi:hypothetical protein